MTLLYPFACKCDLDDYAFFLLFLHLLFSRNKRLGCSVKAGSKWNSFQQQVLVFRFQWHMQRKPPHEGNQDSSCSDEPSVWWRIVHLFIQDPDSLEPAERFWWTIEAMSSLQETLVSILPPLHILKILHLRLKLSQMKLYDFTWSSLSFFFTQKALSINSLKCIYSAGLCL